MNIERALISKIIQTRTLKGIVQKVGTEHFYSDAKEVYAYVLDYFKQYREVPTRKILNQRFPNFKIRKEVEEPVEVLLDHVKDKYIYNNLAKVIKNSSEMLQTDTKKAFSYLRDKMIDLKEDNDGTDVSWTKNAIKRLKAYKKAKLGGIEAIPTNWSRLNGAIMGWRPERLVTICGRPAVGKSWHLTVDAHVAWKNGYNVLLIEREMSNSELEERLDALHLRIGASKLTKVELDDETQKMYFQGLRKLKHESSAEIIITSEGKDFSGVAQKINEYRPDIVMIDGVYLMEDNEADGNTERLYNITRRMKQIAKQYRVPILQTAQMGRGSYAGLGGEDRLAKIAGADSFGQDSDVVIELCSSNKCMQAHMIYQYLAKNRGGLQGIMMPCRWSFDTMSFREYKSHETPPVSVKEMKTASKADEADKAVKTY